MLGGAEVIETVFNIPGMGRLLLCAAFLIVVLQAVLVYAVPAAEDAGLSRFAAGASESRCPEDQHQPLQREHRRNVGDGPVDRRVTLPQEAPRHPDPHEPKRDPDEAARPPRRPGV